MFSLFFLSGSAMHDMAPLLSASSTIVPAKELSATRSGDAERRHPAPPYTRRCRAFPPPPAVAVEFYSIGVSSTCVPD